MPSRGGAPVTPPPSPSPDAGARTRPQTNPQMSASSGHGLTVQRAVDPSEFWKNP